MVENFNQKVPLLESQVTQSETHTQDESMYNASNSQVNAEDEYYMNALRQSPKFGGPSDNENTVKSSFFMSAKTE